MSDAHTLDKAGGRFKVVELSRVNDEAIEHELNRLDALGYDLRDIRFVTQDGVRRPTMAFLVFEARASEPTS